MLPHPLQQVNAVAVGQAQVGENEVYSFCFNDFLGTRDAAGRLYLEAFLSQPGLQHHAIRDIIFYNQYRLHKRKYYLYTTQR